MVLILLFFVAGIFGGWFIKKEKRLLSAGRALTMFSILTLLFLLGYEAGLNPAVKTHFGDIGVKALFISFLSVSGSIVFVVLFNRYLLKK